VTVARFLGVDIGRRRIGLALSDASSTLATPLRTVEAAASAVRSAERLARELSSASDPDPLSEVAGVVVGLPRRLNGEDTDQTGPAREFARVLADRTGLPVHLQDERLTSREAEARLAVRDRDWRSRKAKLDAAAAAIVLQDFLDSRVVPGHAGERAES
jgi:putative Holliday junction resolvase